MGLFLSRTSLRAKVCLRRHQCSVNRFCGIHRLCKAMHAKGPLKHFCRSGTELPTSYLLRTHCWTQQSGSVKKYCGIDVLLSYERKNKKSHFCRNWQSLLTTQLHIKRQPDHLNILNQEMVRNWISILKNDQKRYGKEIWWDSLFDKSKLNCFAQLASQINRGSVKQFGGIPLLCKAMLGTVSVKKFCGIWFAWKQA